MKKRIYVRVGLGALSLAVFIFDNSFGWRLLEFARESKSLWLDVWQIETALNFYLPVVNAYIFFAFFLSILRKAPVRHIWLAALILTLAIAATVPPAVEIGFVGFFLLVSSIGPKTTMWPANLVYLLAIFAYVAALVLAWRWATL